MFEAVQSASASVSGGEAEHSAPSSRVCREASRLLQYSSIESTWNRFRFFDELYSLNQCTCHDYFVLVRGPPHPSTWYPMPEGS